MEVRGLSKSLLLAVACLWAVGCGVEDAPLEAGSDVSVDPTTGESSLAVRDAAPEDLSFSVARPSIAPSYSFDSSAAHDLEVADDQLERAPLAPRGCLDCLTARPSCRASDLTFTTFPLAGTNGRHYVINNYTDLNPAAGSKTDFMGFINALARNYDGHGGADIDIPSFREMDSGAAIVRAAAPGVVTFVREDQVDRNTISLSGCTATWNVVRVEHANGFSTLYGHLKRNSVTVQVGDTVQAGTVLGVAGSSGCSTAAHLHFEVRDCDDDRVESFNSMWANPPAYNAPADVMDVMLRSGSAPTVAQIKDPAPNVTLVKPGSVLGIGLSMGSRQGTQVGFELVGPGGTDSWSWTQGGNARFRHSYVSWTRTVGTAPGSYSLRVFVDGSLRATRSFKVSNYAPGSAEVSRHGIPAASFQTLFTDITSAGYMPIWVDGYDVGGNTYFNAIFRPANGTPWVARHDRTAAQYQSDVNTWTGFGYRPFMVDSYLDGGVRYAVIFVKDGGPNVAAYHGRTAAEHQALFNSWTNLGYRPKNVSVVTVAGQRYYTGLYELKNVGSFELRSFMTPAEYQNFFNANKAAGRYLHYLNAYTFNGAVRFTAVWNSVPHGPYAATHHRTGAQYQASWQNWTGQGYLTEFVTGYSNGGTANFGALWAK